MDSAIQSDATLIQMKTYAALAILTAVGYDYILTLSNEIEYIWNKPWSRVSTLFVLTRYVGLCNVIVYVSSLTEVDRSGDFISALFHNGMTFGIFDTWASFIFIGAAQLVMILRVWALYNRSMVILVTLLMFYAIEFVLFFVIAVIISVQIQYTDQVSQFSFCEVDDSSLMWNEIMNYVQLALGTLMCLLIAVEFAKQSLQMYKVTKQFQVSCYINLLTREGVIYFLFVLTLAAIALAETTNLQMDSRTLTLMDMIEYIPTITLIPRFIMGLRKLYADDLRRRRGSEIDTAFGLSSTSGPSVGLSMILFEDAEQNIWLEGQDEIGMDDICSGRNGA